MIMIDDKEGMRFFQLLQFKGRLSIEVSTGLGFKQPTLKIYNQVFGASFSRKAHALADCERRIEVAKLENFIRKILESHNPGPECVEYNCLCQEGAAEAFEILFKALSEREIELERKG